MVDPIFSPDGNFMWTGTEWIPAPPNVTDAPKQSAPNTFTMNDSVMSGDIVHNTVVNNDATVVTTAVIEALKHLGVIGANPSEMVTTLPPEAVELPAAFQVGDHVEYYSPTNERWLDRCKVIGINADGTYEIEVPYTDTVQIKPAVIIGTTPGTIRPASPPYVVGDKVLVNWKNYGTYYPATIAKDHENHTYLIHFDDGDIEDEVEWNRVEKLALESTEIQEYVEHISEAEFELIEAFKVFDDDNSGMISASEYFKILTELGDEPLSPEDVMREFQELGIGEDSEINYRELAKYLVGSEMLANAEPRKPEVLIQNTEIRDGLLYGHAYAHPKLGDAKNLRSSPIVSVTYDERATARVETQNTVYIVGPTGWSVRPEDHPFNVQIFEPGQAVKVEWQGSWWDAIIRERRNSDYLIHYVGFESSWDEWVNPNRIR